MTTVEERVPAIVAIMGDEVGHAYVMVDRAARGAPLDLDELLGFARERLANYKVPKRIEIADELPMLAVGKVDKVALRARANGD